MRTTQKRRLGRAETNGHATLPPSPLTAMTRYGGPPRHGAAWLVGKFFVWFAVFLLVAVGALGGGAWLFFKESVAAVRPHTVEVKEAQKFLDAPLPGKPTVALVIGYDHRSHGVDRSADSRSDTLMLIRADPQRRAISVLSFPRDLIVEIPGCRGHPPWTGRINEAYSECKTKGSLRTIKQLTGVPINYMITVNFEGFVGIVNRLGGVYMDIDRRYFNDNSGVSPGFTYSKINLHSGYQKLTGSQALSFVRFRHTDSDLYRVVRQQEFVKAVKQQISSFWSIAKVPGIINTITQNVEVARGGSKQLDANDVIGYAKLAYTLPSGNFQQVGLEGLTGYNELSAAPGSIETAIRKFMHPDTSAAERAVSAATGQKAKPTATAPDPTTVTVEVLNGNGHAGSADDAAYLLSQHGYRVVNGGNADNFAYFHTKVVYDPSVAGALASLFADAAVAPLGPGQTQSTMLRVAVGQTFHGSLAPPVQDETPKHVPPAVSVDLEARSLLRGVRRKVDFPALAPRLRAQNSFLDQEEELRVYRLNGHSALRLVYRLGTANEYWGIEETSWTDAPILGQPTLTRRIGGREYMFYFNRSHLHMVAFVENGTAYWVVNTLLDRLSNETLLAIAKGLEPLKRH
jgi:LCP family protein required for cell wall assembly